MTHDFEIPVSFQSYGPRPWENARCPHDGLVAEQTTVHDSARSVLASRREPLPSFPALLCGASVAQMGGRLRASGRPSGDWVPGASESRCGDTTDRDASPPGSPPVHHLLTSQTGVRCVWSSWCWVQRDRFQVKGAGHSCGPVCSHPSGATAGSHSPPFTSGPCVRWTPVSCD